MTDFGPEEGTKKKQSRASKDASRKGEYYGLKVYGDRLGAPSGSTASLSDRSPEVFTGSKKGDIQDGS